MPKSKTLTVAIILFGTLAFACGGIEDDPSLDPKLGANSEALATVGTRMRFANLAPGLSARPCISLAFGAFSFVSGGPISPDCIRGYQNVSASSWTRIRWVASNAPNCTNRIAGTGDQTIASVSAGDQFTFVLYGERGSRDTAFFDDQDLPSFSSTRFYVRYFHGGDGLGTLVGRTTECSNPATNPLFGGPIFNPANYGALASSTNVIPGQADTTVFSAAVSAGGTSFTTDHRTCRGAAEISEARSVRFDGGVMTDIFLTGNGTAGSPYRLITCRDSVTSPVSCAP